MNWLRWHQGTCADPKLSVVARRAGQPKATIVGIWAAMLEHASLRMPRGSLEGWDHEAAGVLLDLDPETVTKVWGAMQAKGMHDGKMLTAWARRQYERVGNGDSSTERVRRYRERKRHGETGGNAVAAPDTPLQRGETGDVTAETPLQDVAATAVTGNAAKHVPEADTETDIPIAALSEAPGASSAAPVVAIDPVVRQEPPPVPAMPSNVEEFPALPLWSIRVGPDAAGIENWAKPLFDHGLKWLAKAEGKAPDRLRSLIGHWLQLADQDHKRVFKLLVRAESEGIAVPAEWITAHLGGKTDGQDPATGNAGSTGRPLAGAAAALAGIARTSQR